MIRPSQVEESATDDIQFAHRIAVRFQTCDVVGHRRAPAEINQFEAQLLAHGIVLVKFWFHITKDEQLGRFRARETAAYKRWKLTDEDWRNRAKWTEYERAVTEMVERTSTRQAPWTLVEANDKLFARLKVLETVCDRLAAEVG